MSKLSAQRGIIDPKIIAGGIVVLVVIFFLATGNFKFSASVKDNSSQKTVQEDTKEQATPQPTSKPKVYENKENKISLEYPDDWSLKENPAEGYIAVFISPKEERGDTYQENLGIKAVDVSSQPNVTLQEIADLWENQTKKAEGTFVVTDRKSSSVAGEDAKDLVYTFKDNNDNGKGMTRITLKNKKAYIFQYNALETDYGKYLPDIEAILASVKF